MHRKRNILFDYLTGDQKLIEFKKLNTEDRGKKYISLIEALESNEQKFRAFTYLSPVQKRTMFTQTIKHMNDCDDLKVNMVLSYITEEKQKIFSLSQLINHENKRFSSLGETAEHFYKIISKKLKSQDPKIKKSTFEDLTKIPEEERLFHITSECTRIMGARIARDPQSNTPYATLT